MSNSEYEKQVGDARKIHFSLPVNLDDSAIVFSKPAEKIYHPLQFREQTAEEIEIQNNELKNFRNLKFHSLGDIPMTSAADDYFDFGIPYLDARERFVDDYFYDRAWGANPNFKLLKDFIANGLIPSDAFGNSAIEPPPFHRVMERARKEGYTIPDKFLEPKNVRDDKKNALYAAYDLKSRQIHFEADNSRHQRITSLNAGFLVPDPDDDWRIPIVLDQLWIIKEEEACVRFIAVEIVAADQADEKTALGAIRTEKLERQGIELYRVSGAWCRVDPWRAMSEFLYEAGVYPTARDGFGCPELKKIGDYVCSHCGQPMIRFDSHWVEKCWGRYVDDDFLPFNPPLHLHPQCAGEVMQNY